jgi:predicted amidohydrolase
MKTEQDQHQWQMGHSVVRFAGAQVAVTHDVSKNVETLKRAIDWAGENEVDYLVTPEGALSGYNTNFADSEEQVTNLHSAEREIVNYAASKHVGLCLGTFWVEDELIGKIKRNQARYYDQTGEHRGSYNKIMTIPGDGAVLPGMFVDAGSRTETGDYNFGHPTIDLMPTDDPQATFSVSTLICNDVYGETQKGESIARRACYSMMNRPVRCSLVLHPTYGFRGEDYAIEGQEFKMAEAMRNWHTSTIQQLSYFTEVSFFCVESASFQSGEASTEISNTPSGAVEKGEWVVKVPSGSEQFFFHDFMLPVVLPAETSTNPSRLAMMEANNPAPIEE